MTNVEDLIKQTERKLVRRSKARLTPKKKEAPLPPAVRKRDIQRQEEKTSRADKLLEKADEILRDGMSKKKIEKASLRDCAQAINVLIDKSQVLMGEATTHTAVLVAVLEAREGAMRNGKIEDAERQQAIEDAVEAEFVSGPDPAAGEGDRPVGSSH